MSVLKFKQLIVAVTVTLIVVTLTHIPMEYMSDRLAVDGFDKLMHALAYGIITFFFLLAIRTSVSLLSLFFLFCVVTSIGAIDELTQSFVNRTLSMNDWLADIIGCIVVLYSFLYFNRLRYRVSSTKDQ